MSLPADTPPAIADALGYLQHHLQELTERQNASEHVINNTLTGLTAQIQQLTQLMTGPAPAPTVALPLIPTSPPPVSPPLPVLSALSKQRTRPKLPSPPDFSGEQSSSRAFFNSYMLYLRLVPEQFSCEVVREPLSPGSGHWHLFYLILGPLRTTIPEPILFSQCRSRRR